MTQKVMARTVSVGLLLVVILALTGALAFMSGSFTDLAKSEADEKIEITENQTTVSITLTQTIESQHIYVETESGTYRDGGIPNGSVESILGPSDGRQYLYSAETGGVGTTVRVNISEVSEGTISVIKIRNNAEETILTYNHN